MYRGFSSRFAQELNFLVENKVEFEELKGLKGQFTFLHTIFPANYITWLGASILGSLEYINNFSTTLENYKK
jgi:actin-related protein